MIFVDFRWACSHIEGRMDQLDPAPCVFSSSKQFWACFHVENRKARPKVNCAREQVRWMSAFQASACLTFATIPLVKARQSGRGLQRCRTKWIEFRKVIHWIYWCNQSDTNAVNDFLLHFVLVRTQIKLLY